MPKYHDRLVADMGEAVSPVPAAVVKSRAAYVLFYKRRATS